MLKKIFILSGLISFLAINAQKTHTVEPKENPYSISKKYGLTLDELYKLNPKIKDGTLNIGDVLVIGKSGDKVATVAPQTSNNSGKVGSIILQPKQTVYGITKQYHITEVDLRKLNPELDSHMKIGDEVKLPLDLIKKYGGDVSSSTSTNAVKPAVSSNADDYYTVQAKDNYYKISREFNITQKQLFALNPGLEAKGLSTGDKIKVKGDVNISVEDNSKTIIKESEALTKTTSVKENASSNDDYITYTVKSGDTVFGITNKFSVGLNELLELNPDLANGLKSGMVLKIKKQDPMYSKKGGDNLNVVLMLPFGFDANDNKYRSMSLDFLTGAKLAIERQVKAGMKLDIKVIDAGNENAFKSSISQINQDNTDLIIGPFFKTNVIDVLNFVKGKKIPVVAPFANSEDLYDYSNLIIVETNINAYADRLVKEVSQVFSDQKIYIVADDNKSNANAIKLGLEKALKKPNISIVNSPADIQLDQNMMTGQSAPVITILANDDENIGATYASKIIALSKETDGIKAFSMFYNPSFEKKVDDLSKASLVYLIDKKINTDGDFEKKVLSDYKAKYCKTPAKYAVVGFDVVNDMLMRENKKGEIFKQMNKSQTQLAGKFEFERVKPNGAYINNGYRVVRLVP